MAIVAGTRAAPRGERWRLLIVEGAANLAVAGTVLVWPTIALVPFFRLAGVWGVVTGSVILTLLAPSHLAGPTLALAAVAVALHALLDSRLPAPERFLWLLVAGGLACLATPEVVYLRDAFDHSDLYRQNIVFKLSYQAWLLETATRAI